MMERCWRGVGVPQSLELEWGLELNWAPAQLPLAGRSEVNRLARRDVTGGQAVGRRAAQHSYFVAAAGTSSSTGKRLRWGLEIAAGCWPGEPYR